MEYAPSIYEYRSTAEWEQAMAEWCYENEPQTETQTETQTLKSNTL